MKVLLGYPPLDRSKGIPLLSQNRQFQYFKNPTYMYPVIMGSAATYIRSEGHETIYRDAVVENLSWPEFEGYMQEAEYDLFAFETKTPVVREHWRAVDRIKKASPKTRIAVVGDHVTAEPMETMVNSAVDFVATGGDYDFQLLGIADFLAGDKELPPGIYYREKEKIRSTGPFELSGDLNELPVIDRELTDWHLYNQEHNIKVRPFAYTMAGRDCPWGKCAFCSWPTLFPRFRVRSVDSVISEIDDLVVRYGVKEVFDDTGTFPPGDWLHEFCRAMKRSGLNRKVNISCNMRVDYVSEDTAKLMTEAGFRLLKMGLESGNQETLDRLEKGIKVDQIRSASRIAHEAGLTVHLTMIVGYPWETRRQAMNTVALAEKLMNTTADLLQSTVVIPYPGTKLFDQAVENDWFLFDCRDYEKYDMSGPVLKTPDMTPEETLELCRSIYRTFFSPSFVLKHLKQIRSFKDAAYLLKGARAVFGHLSDFNRAA